MALGRPSARSSISRRSTVAPLSPALSRWRWTASEIPDQSMIRQSVMRQSYSEGLSIDDDRSAYTFDNPDLLRGTHIADVLKKGGRIFSDSKGDECTYDLSKKVSEIDVFISHNWSTPATRKVQALSLYFNWKAAVIGASVMTLVLVILVYFVHSLPCPQYTTWKGTKRAQGPYCLVLSNSVFVFIMYFWQDLSALAHFRGVIAFLDKTCIHQTDPHLKRQGIAMLAGFLANSHTMLVVYTDEYMQKLWTVYELASFLVLHKQSSMVVMPLLLPRVIMACTLCCILCSMADYIQGLSSVKDLLQVDYSSNWPHLVNYFIMSAPFIPLSFLLQAWTQDLESIGDRVKQFSLANARCFDETDRPVVQRNIAAFMRDMQLVMPDATQKHALNVFDNLVRTQVPQYIKASVGRSGIPYKYVVIMFLSDLWQCADRFAANIRHTVKKRKIVIRLLTGISSTFFIRPVICAVIFRLVRLTAGYSRLGRAICMLPIIILAVGMSMFFYRILNQLEQNALEEYNSLENDNGGLASFPWEFAVYGTFSFYFAMLTLLFYLPVSIPNQNDIYLPESQQPAIPPRSRTVDLGRSFNIELQRIGVFPPSLGDSFCDS